MKIQFQLLMGLLACFIFTSSEAQLSQVYHELYAVDQAGPGLTTYRIFVEMENPGDFLSSVYADGTNSLYIGGSGGTIHNQAAGSTTGDAIATGFCMFVPTLCYDSFVTIGWYGPNDFNGSPISCGQSTTTISTLPNNSAIQDSFGTNEEAPNLQLGDGVWYTTNLIGCNDNGLGVGPTNKILICQVTIPSDDELEYSLNVRIFLNSDGNNAVSYIGNPSELGPGEYNGSGLGLVYPIGNCLDLSACNYNTWPEADENQAFCDFSCNGCMDSAYCNFNPEATVDDGSCTNTCPGCMDSTASNFDENATVEDGSCEFIGCMDPEASNFDPFATEDSGSCEYPGCMAMNAVNYDSTANVDDGSCLFTIEGYVFYDGNLNGTYDNLDFEYGIAYQQVSLEPSGQVVIADENGYYSFENVLTGEYTLAVADNENYLVNTTPSEYSVLPYDLQSSTTYDFGMANDDEYFAIDVDLWVIPWWGYACNGIETNHQITFKNLGTETISGIVQFDYDELFVGYVENTPIDSVVGNSIYMSYENLEPGHTLYYFVGLLTPDFNFLGENLSTTAYVYAMEQEDILAFGDDSYTMMVTCSYDPNDKQVFPPGYDEPHYVLGNQELEYVIRFQNTGNAFAETVLLRDTIAPELDLNSFALESNSHNVLTTIDFETREVQFLFENIMLADSGFSEPDSHGFASYIIKPLEDLPAETQFTNTAYIFFDTNPAVVTNTTWNTIYECGSEGDFTVNAEALCDGEELLAESTHSYVETFLWELDDNMVSEESTYAATLDPGDYELTFTGSNPLCATPQSVNITVYDLPEAVITADGEMLSATEGISWQWYLDGNEIDGATNQSITITDMGTYSVEVTNDAGCSATSEGVTITSIHDLATQMAVLFPNPMTSSSTLILGEGIYSVTITDAAGRIVRAYENINGGTHTLDRDGLASGVYQLQIASKDQPLVQTMQLIVQ